MFVMIVVIISDHKDRCKLGYFFPPNFKETISEIIFAHFNDIIHSSSKFLDFQRAKFK